MVNEVNRAAAIEDEALRRRMESSNRNIQQMQEEHEQLMQEMETLRRTAAELSHNNNNNNNNNAQQLPAVDSPRRPAPPVMSATEAMSPEGVSTESVSIQENSTDTTEKTSNTEAEAYQSVIATASDAEDEDSAKYIREKIAEIAAMKTQFKRVQHMVNTTNLIEAHVARNDPVQQPVDPSSLPESNAADVAKPSLPPVESADVLLNLEQQSSTNTTQENVELLMSLLTMFDEFKNDLRDQATSLRAERDRLRTLKEDLLRRRNQS